MNNEEWNRRQLRPSQVKHDAAALKYLLIAVLAVISGLLATQNLLIGLVFIIAVGVLAIAIRR